MSIFLLLIGLFILVKAGPLFVDGAVQLARSLNISSIVIGAIVLGFGTSAPEVVVSVIAASQGDPALGVGNIVGSNVANLSLVLGVAALVTPIALTSSITKRQGPLSIGAVIIFALLVWTDNKLTRGEGAILLLLLVVAMIVLIKTPADDVLPQQGAEQTLSRSLLSSLVGLGGVLVGAQLTVTGATRLADDLGLSGGFIGFSIVALGTSLPELVTAVAAARKKEAGLIVGNLFGSNLFNGLAGGAAIGLVDAGSITDARLTGGGLIAMVGAVGFAYVQGTRKRRIGKTDALLLLAIYAAAMLWLGIS